MKKSFIVSKNIIGLFLIFLIGFAVFSIRFSGFSNAASSDIEILINNSPIGNDPYVMRTKTLTLLFNSPGHPVYANDSAYTIDWFVASAAEQQIIDVTSSEKTVAIVTAKKPGTATITVKVSYTDASGTQMEVESMTCQVKVLFSIDTSVDTSFKKISSSAEREALIMSVDDVKDMQLNFGNATDTNCKWTSDNEDIIKVTTSTSSNLNGGTVTAIGAGKTTLRASYTPDNETTAMTDSIDVYVVPKFSEDNVTFYTSNTLKLHTGSMIFTDTVYERNGGGIKDKLTWIIEKNVNGSSQIIADSIGKTSDLISLDVVSDTRSGLRVNAKAGEYTIKFFPKGIYEANQNVTLSEISDTFYSSMNLIVYGEFSDKTATLNIGDGYNVADAFNLTVSDFVSIFGSYVSSDESNVFSYLPSSAMGTALTKGDANIIITINNSSLAQYLSEAAISAGGYTVKINVIDSLSLDRTSVTLALGAELQLVESHTSYGGTFTWSSSDKNYVTVTQNGLIKAIKVTEDNKDVTITVTQTFSNGNIKKATCLVKVVNTVTNISLNYDEVVLEVDKTVTILATFTPNVSTAPIKWLSSDEELVSLSVASDNKSVVVTGKKAGKVILTAVNKDNFVTACVTITVLSPIKTINLNQTQATVKMNREVVRLKATYTPTDATSTDLRWTSSNTAVATVDEQGLVTLVSAGTVIITVQPEYNPYFVMDQCVMTVVQSATGFYLSQSSVTLEVGKSQKLEYTLNPSNATTSITWKSLDTSIATISSTGTVTAVGSGKTHIIATTEDGAVDTCTIIVTQAASGITLSVYDLTLGIGDTYQVIANPSPATSSETTFTWTSKDPSIATVTKAGKVTGVSAGSTIILVKTASGKVEYLYITVFADVTGMTLNYTTKTIVKGKTFTLKPVFTPTNPSNKNVKWQSANTKVATVTSGGVVKGIRGGVTVIACISEDGGYVANCVVTVTQVVTSITLNKSSYTLGIGKTVSLKATIKSNYATNQKLKWTSSNIKVATVSSKGVVTGKKLGTITIKVAATDGSGEYATCKIRVVRQATSITLNKTTLRMLVGTTTKIRASVSPSTATYRTVKWSTSDEEVATVDVNGNVSAVKEGSCKITAKAKDNSGKQAVCWVYVSKAVASTSVSVSQKDMVMVKGTAAMVSVSISPSNSTDKVYFSSDNKSVASVTSSGRVTARKPGVATITVRTSSGRYALVNVTVVGLNISSLSLTQYDTADLWVEEIGTGVRWFSENPSIASVSAGHIIARKVGRTRIVAVVSGVKLYCTVNVTRSVR
ncbi:Ig-like domain-containing protein [Anaeromicropila populeti]|uniref:Uncharacterized conserved protein YjdB, contains Ig-like domain n=1 Tax=Anaeromicropila populeti TaxID=37658 RepID=A0A1I6IKX0_9FIRM|nr:Ig-like domain-containing protein [Anaeromicropila populeti]SFR67382.1 Uncharacterized conserved protein YjdB, contains Ig-like domain [Anaeromicropila populeti]